MVFKDYKMKGYTLHTIKTDKFKMCHVEVILETMLLKKKLLKEIYYLICFVSALIVIRVKET